LADSLKIALLDLKTVEAAIGDAMDDARAITAGDFGSLRLCEALCTGAYQLILPFASGGGHTPGAAPDPPAAGDGATLRRLRRAIITVGTVAEALRDQRLEAARALAEEAARVLELVSESWRS
jgi:hypothetical protein